MKQNRRFLNDKIAQQEAYRLLDIELKEWEAVQLNEFMEYLNNKGISTHNVSLEISKNK